jgi:hypothetical protein
MEFSQRVLGYRSFWDEPDIRALVRESKNFDESSEKIEEAKSLLIFQTTKQHTWLVSSKERLYCILDDGRKPKPRIQWSLSKKRLKASGAYTNSIKTRSKTESTGVIDIGIRHKYWLYTKRLFPDKSIEHKVEELLSNT